VIKFVSDLQLDGDFLQGIKLTEVSEGVIRNRKSRDTIQWAKDKGQKDKQ
jgi:hypothetical protein